MNIVLIYPPDPIFQNTTNTVLHNSLDMMPLGLLYIGTVLEEKGHCVKVFDFNDKSKSESEILNGIANFHPKIIGISASSTMFPFAVNLVRKLQKSSEKYIFVWGGHHVTFLPYDPFYQEVADIVIRGEGEYAMLEIVEVISEYGEEYHNHLDFIEGITYLRDKRFIDNAPRILRINNLDELPFPNRELLNIKSYSNPFTIIMSRGCMGKCTFCASALMGKAVMRTAENIIEEIEYLKAKYNINHLIFLDNIFGFDKTRINVFLEELIKKQYKITYSAELNIKYTDFSVLKKMKYSGLTNVQYGIESGSNFILNSIKKGVTIEECYEKVVQTLGLGINVLCSFIIGFPEDDEESIMKTIEYAKRLKRAGAQIAFSCFVPYPGSELYFKLYDNQNYDIDYGSWANVNEPIIATEKISKRELRKLYSSALYSLYSI